MEITSMSPKLAQLLWPLLWALAYVRSEEASSDRGKAFLLCKAALWRKWSERGPEEVSALVKSTMQGREELSYEQTARMLAERQLAQCAREVTSADLEAHAAGRLSDAVVDRLVAIEGSEPTLSAEDREQFEAAGSGSSEGPSILGVQVHRIPVGLQLLYMILVVVAVSYVVFMVVRQLTARDKAKAVKAEEKKKEKEGKKK
ncbi:unnamed protein product [Durusdinium trenchii]|uniref:Transmembrane protein n=1 Tax=Durusdinium trenchii TaxID=1381693 RepID=A0ABP0NUM4_9DINO